MREVGYERLARKLVQLSGGEENIQAVFHCSTRLHFNVFPKEVSHPQGM
ncbi:PTS transporter subunit EIIB [Heyndrickxia coagulans]